MHVFIIRGAESSLDVVDHTVVSVHQISALLPPWDLESEYMDSFVPLAKFTRQTSEGTDAYSRRFEGGIPGRGQESMRSGESAS